MAGPSFLHERYRVLRRLGGGRFATVYLADDLQEGRPVAIKVVPRTADTEGRVRREVEAAARLAHRHIVRTYEVIEEKDRTILVSEYIAGSTLRELYRDRCLSDREIAEIGVQLASALEHAHKHGVVHRDVKPENVMLVDGESIEARLMDFGVAQLEDDTSVTMAGDLVGTLAYMSPEQGEGKNVDSRSDVYSLALVLYEGFTGKNPLRGHKLEELLHDVSRPDIPPLALGRPDLPEALSGLLAQAMARDRRARPDAGTFGRQLAQIARRLSDEIPESTVATQIRRLRLPSPYNERLAFLGGRLVAGGSSLACLLYLLPKLPFYPEVALLPLVAIPAFLALVWPFAGGVVTLAVLAPPVFAYAVGWGVLYAVSATVVFGLLRWRRREWAALLPGLVPVAVSGGLGLALLPLTGLFLRRWGALAGFCMGLSLAVTAGLAGWSALPYFFTTGTGPVLAVTRHVASLWAVLVELARLLDARPELALQIALFTVFSLPFYAWLGASRAGRMWGATLYLGAMFLAYLLTPVLVLDLRVSLGSFLAAFGPCAIIAYLSALVAPAKGTVSL